MKKAVWILIIAAAAAAAAFFGTIWNARNKASEAVEAYNAAVEEYNGKIAPFNEAAAQILEANTAFRNVLDQARLSADSKEAAYEPETLKKLQDTLEDAEKVLVEAPVQIEPFERKEEVLGFDKKDLDAVRQEAEAAESAVREAEARIPGVPAVPDYSGEASAVEAARKSYEDSVRKLSNVTAPADAFVSERLLRLEAVSYTGAVTPENDPNGLLGKKGGYIGCIYFIEDSVDRSLLPEGTFREELPAREREEAPSAEDPDAAAAQTDADTPAEEQTAAPGTAAPAEETAAAGNGMSAEEAAAAGTAEPAQETAALSGTAAAEETAALSGTAAAEGEAAGAAGTGATAAVPAEPVETADAVLAGANGGGAVEIFASKEDAQARIAYFEFFEGSIMQPGAADVEGTCVIRASRYLDEERQKELIEEVRQVLLLVE